MAVRPSARQQAERGSAWGTIQVRKGSRPVEDPLHHPSSWDMSGEERCAWAVLGYLDFTDLIEY